MKKLLLLLPVALFALSAIAEIPDLDPPCYCNVSRYSFESSIEQKSYKQSIEKKEIKKETKSQKSLNYDFFQSGFGFKKMFGQFCMNLNWNRSFNNCIIKKSLEQSNRNVNAKMMINYLTDEQKKLVCKCTDEEKTVLFNSTDEEKQTFYKSANYKDLTQNKEFQRNLRNGLLERLDRKI